MTFQDIFKSSFLENIASISILDMAIAMVLAFLLGLFIFFIYKKSYSGVMYSASFGVTLIALSLITTLLIMTVVSNIVLSLGMVGALSIVRFRTVIKEPMDLSLIHILQRSLKCMAALLLAVKLDDRFCFIIPGLFFSG